jgi:hypothetical protein
LAFVSFFLLLEALLLLEGSISASSVKAAVDRLVLVFLVDRALSVASGKEELADFPVVGSLFEELDPRVLLVVDLELEDLFAGVALVRVVVVVAGGISSRSDSCGLLSITMKVLGFS